MKKIKFLFTLLICISFGGAIVKILPQEAKKNSAMKPGNEAYNSNENLSSGYKNILNFYELLEGYEFTNLYLETSIQSEIERDFVLKPKDEFESLEDYKKRTNDFESKKNEVIENRRIKEFFALQKARGKIKIFLDSTGLFSKPFILESNNKEPLTMQLGTYDFDTKSFPIFCSASTQLFDYINNSGRVSFSFVEDAKKFKEDFTNNKYKLIGQFHYEMELNGTISVIIEELQLMNTETKAELNVVFSDIHKAYLKSEIPLLTIKKGRELITGYSIGTEIKFNIIYSPDKKYVALFESGNPAIEIYNLYTAKIISRLTKEYQKNLTGSGDIYSFLNLIGRFSSDGNKLITWNPCWDPIGHRNQEDLITLWDISNSKLINTYGGTKNDIEYATLSFDGSLLLTLFYNIGIRGGNLKISDLKTSKKITTIPLKNLEKYESAILYNTNDAKFTFSMGGGYIYVFMKDYIINYNIIDYKKNGEMLSYKTVASTTENYFMTNDFKIRDREENGFRYNVSDDRKTLVIWKKLDFQKFLKRDDSQTKVLVFDNCSCADLNYLRFRDTDNSIWGFGEGPTEVFDYQLFSFNEISGQCEANKEYVGRKFQINYGFIDWFNYNNQTENIQTIKNAIIHDLNINPIPDEFFTTFNSFHNALKEDNFNEAINYFIFPQDQGIFHKSDRKKIINEMNNYWKNHDWNDPNIRVEARNYYNEKSKDWTNNIEGISVDFIKEDISFFFIKKDKQYKILSVFVNLEGGD